MKTFLADPGQRVAPEDDEPLQAKALPPRAGQESPLKSEDERPTVDWKLFINPKDHDEAERTNQRGMMYDLDKSPGYRASMIKAYQEEVFGACLGGRIDYEEYERLHDVVTAHLIGDPVGHGNSLESIRTRSSVDAGTEFAIRDWEGDDVGVAEDLRNEFLGGMRMVSDRRDDMRLLNADDGEDRRSVVAFDPAVGGGRYYVRYSVYEGVEFVRRIFARFYEDVGVEGLTGDQKLGAIVKAVRALHVTHPFKDANGRLHVQILLNRLLRTYEFPMTILPRKFGLGVFGGAFTIDRLVEMVKEGFQ